MRPPVAANGRHSADSALVVALSGGQTLQSAAKQAGVSERTVRRRLADPAFRSQLAAAQAATLASAVAALGAASGEAVTALRGLLASGPPATRLGAAKAILELGVRLRESENLERRVAELEAGAAQRKEARPCAS
ncbi:MAG: hypothetical protein HY690_02935 [Chloroflexi bacterium]|nr:hypothetical protein [Chloroflexota bacterium]